MFLRGGNSALGWQDILYWSTEYKVVLWVGVFLMGASLSYVIYFKRLYHQYQLTQQQVRYYQQQWNNGHACIQQTAHYQQLYQQRQTVTPLIAVNELNFSDVLARITQLSERHAVPLIQLQQQHNPWLITVEVKVDFWLFIRLLQALIQLPYALQITQVTLVVTHLDIDAKPLTGSIVLEMYDHE